MSSLYLPFISCWEGQCHFVLLFYQRQTKNMGQVLYKGPLYNTNILGLEWLRPRPHESGLKPHFFFTARSKPVNPDTETTLKPLSRAV